MHRSAVLFSHKKYLIIFAKFFGVKGEFSGMTSGRKRKHYIRPNIDKIDLDSSISLVMMSGGPEPPPRPTGGGKGMTPDPFASPFSNKPFS
jgi:hypothetical protein